MIGGPVLTLVAVTGCRGRVPRTVTYSSTDDCPATPGTSPVPVTITRRSGASSMEIVLTGGSGGGGGGAASSSRAAAAAAGPA